MSIHSRVVELVMEWEEQRERGLVVTPEELCARTPDLLPEVKRRIEQIQRFNNLAGPSTAADGARPGTAEAGMPVIEGYEILEAIGRGGMGVVYKARDLKLKRVVALKMIRDPALAGPDARARFRREAEAVARLTHPHVVQIYEIGECNGLPYFALEYCAGGSLAAQLQGTPLPAHHAAQLVQTLAVAVHAAHEAGIVHRDLKPGNILIQTTKTTENTEKRPRDAASLLSVFSASSVVKIADFGLAKMVGSGEAAGETASGAIVGTPSYMAPEQARGATSEHEPGIRVGPPADVYALGAILYELLTGRPPFRAANAMDTLLQVINDEPAPPSRLNPGTPRDLETICLKCLQKEPGKRYASAQALAQDVERFRKGEPISARPVGRLERTVKWVRRNPGVAGMSLAVAVVLVVGATVATIFGIRANEHAENLQAQKKATETALKQSDFEEAKAKFVAYSFQLDAARQLIERGQFGEALAQLRVCDPKLCAWEHDYLSLQCIEKVRDATTGQKAFTLKGHAVPVFSGLSADGKRIVSGSQDGTVKVWDATSGKEALTLKGHSGNVTSVALSADGKRIVSGSIDGTVKFWDATTGKEVLALKGGHFPSVRSVALSADGKRIASGNWDGTVQVWDATTGQEALTLKGHTAPVFSVALSADSNRIVSGSDDSTVKVWDARSGKEALTLKGHSANVTSVALSADGKRIVSGSSDGTVKVWDATSGEDALTLKGHSGDVYSVVLSADRKRIVSGSQDGTVKVWDATTGQEALTLKGHRARFSVALSADGKRIVSGSIDGTVKVWDATTGQEALTLKGHTGAINSVAMSAYGTRIVSGSTDSTVKVWDALTGLEALTLKGHTHEVFSVALSADGKRIVSASGNKGAASAENTQVKVWDADKGTETLSFKHHIGGFIRVGLSPDGNRIVSAGSADTTVKVWDADKGTETYSLKGHTLSVVMSVAFSHDGTRIVSATAGMDRTVKVWDVQTGTEQCSLKGHTSYVTSVAFSRDCKRIVSGSADRTVKVWDAQTGTEQYSLKGHTCDVTSVAFSSDSKRIVSGSRDLTVKVWDAQTGQEQFSLKGHTSEVTSVAFSSDGKRIVSGSKDRTVKVWDLEVSQPADTPQPFHLTMNGLAGMKALEAEFFPAGWRKEGVFAQVRGPGEARFPTVPVSWYVLEGDLELNTKELLILQVGEPERCIQLSLGPYWDRDTGNEKIVCRLFESRAGMVWWSGELRLNIGERLSFKLVVGDRGGALFFQDKLVLSCKAMPTDLAFRILTRPNTMATIYRCSFREVKKEDLAQLKNWSLPQPELPLQPEKTAKRIKQNMAGLGNQPNEKAAFVPAATGMPLAWIPPGI